MQQLELDFGNNNGTDEQCGDEYCGLSWLMDSDVFIALLYGQ